MVACKIVNRVSAIACTNGTESVLVAPRLCRNAVYGCEVVADVLTAVIARNLVEPLLTKRGQTSAVGGNYNISLRGHKLEVPTVAPKLAHDTLGAALTVEQGGVFLVLVEVGRKDNPYEHLFAIGGLNPAFLALTHRDVVVNLLVDECHLIECPTLAKGVEFGGLHNGVHMEHKVVAHLAERVDVVVARSEHLHLATVEHHAAYLVCGVDGGDEVEGVVTLPYNIRCVVVKGCGLVAHGAILAVPHKQTLLVALVARTAHTAEGNHPIVGTPYGILVIAGHLSPLLADVAGGAGGDVVDEDVRVGRNGIGGTCEVFAGVGKGSTCIVPGNLLAVEIGRKGCIPRLSLHNILTLSYNTIADGGYEDVGVVALIPIVPMAYHQIVVDAGFRLVGLGIYIRAFDVYDVHLLGVEHSLACGGNTKALDTLNVGELLFVASVGEYAPYLTVGHIVEAIANPLWRGAFLHKAHHIATLGRHQIDTRCTLVLGHIVIGNCEGGKGAVGRELLTAYTAHFPHHFGGKFTRCNLFGGEVVCELHNFQSCILATSCKEDCCHCCF